MNIERLSEYYDEENHKSATVTIEKDTGKYAVEVRKIVGFASLKEAEMYAENWTDTQMGKLYNE